ncbi:MAG: aminotransferase class IV [Bacteroidota bacterium]
MKNTADHYCLFNKQLLPISELSIPLQFNRAFRYGDGLFETIRVIDGHPQLLSKHWDRLRNGMQFLQVAIPEEWSANFWQQQIGRLTADTGNWRIRLSVFRQAAGLYTPNSNHCNFLLECMPLPNDRYEPNLEGLNIHICQSIRLSTHALSQHKTLNALPYVLAGLEKQKNGWDDALLLNEQGQVAEACSSNIFLLLNGELLTPPLTDGCVAGVMRRHILEVAPQLGLVVREASLSIEQIEQGEELFLSNAIQGIKWVKQLNNRTFGQNLYPKLLQQINLRIE